MPQYETTTTESNMTVGNILPDSMKMTAEQEERLEAIRIKAKNRHERNRKAAYARGRTDFPLLPFECSWAYWLQFLTGRTA